MKYVWMDSWACFAVGEWSTFLVINRATISSSVARRPAENRVKSRFTRNKPGRFCPSRRIGGRHAHASWTERRWQYCRWSSLT